jgi:hypothetical protein
MPDMTPEERAQIPKLDGDQNVRDNKLGRFTEEARRVTEPEAVTVERDRKSLDTERHNDDRVELTIGKVIEDILSPIELLDDIDEVRKVRALAHMAIDAEFVRAGHAIDTENLSFSAALNLAKQGMAIQRDGWNGKDLVVRLQHPDSESFMTLPYSYISYPDGRRGPWVPSVSDLLAEDWRAI